MLLVIHSLLVLYLIRVSNQIQVRTEVESGNITSRQNFYQPYPQFQFQYRPDLGGPWKNVNWNQPVYYSPPSPKRPIVGIGSATQVQFPGPVNNNGYSSNKNKYPNMMGRNDSPTPTPQSQNKYAADVLKKQKLLTKITRYVLSFSRDKIPDTGVKLTNSCKCGVVQTADALIRITGGTISKENAWPWMAAIVYVRLA